MAMEVKTDAVRFTSNTVGPVNLWYADTLDDGRLHLGVCTLDYCVHGCQVESDRTLRAVYCAVYVHQHQPVSHASRHVSLLYRCRAFY